MILMIYLLCWGASSLCPLVSLRGHPAPTPALTYSENQAFVLICPIANVERPAGHTDSNNMLLVGGLGEVVEGAHVQ